MKLWIRLSLVLHYYILFLEEREYLVFISEAKWEDTRSVGRGIQFYMKEIRGADSRARFPFQVQVRDSVFLG